MTVLSSQMMRVRVVPGITYQSKTGKSFKGQMKDRFLLADCRAVLSGNYRYRQLFFAVIKLLALFDRFSHTNEYLITSYHPQKQKKKHILLSSNSIGRCRGSVDFFTTHTCVLTKQVLCSVFKNPI